MYCVIFDLFWQLFHSHPLEKCLLVLNVTTALIWTFVVNDLLIVRQLWNVIKIALVYIFLSLLIIHLSFSNYLSLVVFFVLCATVCAMVN